MFLQVVIDSVTSIREKHRIEIFSCIFLVVVTVKRSSAKCSRLMDFSLPFF